MRGRTTFYRKLTYLAALAALLWLMSLLSRPAAITPAGEDRGGKLAQLRSEYQLGQAELGDIDPAGEAMKLATLGLRGVAVNLLWEKANYYKKTEDWTNLTATLKQLAKLQPNFITFWKFQAWNLSYNVSAEFDDYHDRYYYVIEGIKFLKQGERYNRDHPRLLYDLGWFICQKIGRADEHVQFRRLFKADNDFHPPDRPPDQRDNWLVGKQWYRRGIEAVDFKGKSMGPMNPLLYYNKPAMAQMYYGEAIEEEGFFDKARSSWVKAGEEWDEYGDRVFEHSAGIPVRLGDEPRLEREVAELQSQLDAFRPDTRAQLRDEKRAELGQAERDAVDTPAAQRTERQSELVHQAQRKLTVSNLEVAEAIARQMPEKEREAYALARELTDTQRKLRYTRQYKDDANYDYWANRAAFEQTKNALDARKSIYQARRAFREEGDLLTAKALYDEGFKKWRLVIEEFPFILNEDVITGDDLIDVIKQYRKVLDQLDERLGEDFPLWDIVALFDSEREFADELQEHRSAQEPAADDAEVGEPD